MPVKKTFTVLIILFLFAVKTASASWWPVQSIDTMKYSRDTAGEKLNDPDFDKVIDQQISLIAKTGATHVAIATPYDERFLPFLKRWVTAARKYNLKVWYRGNFSGWEQWFGFSKISRAEHTKLLQDFLEKHQDLFTDGDIFTSCPECENGGPGDPRITGDVDGHRNFLINEYKISSGIFAKIDKKVSTNFNSMNYDVAKLIMDKDTTRNLGGMIVVDHYVKTPKQLLDDIRKISNQSQSPVFLGEIGAPIPDIHGAMTPAEQAEWLRETLSELSDEKEIYGLNYWVSTGGSTGIWSDDGAPKPTVQILTNFFTPKIITGKVYDEFGNPLNGVLISSTDRETFSDKAGSFSLPYWQQVSTISAQLPGYQKSDFDLQKGNEKIAINLKSTDNSLWYKIIGFTKRFFTFW